MSTLRVTNLKGGSAGSAPNLPDGANITGVVTATSFSGSGANLTGIDATALKDSGGSVKIQANSDGAVVTGVLTAPTVSATTGSFTSNVSVGGTLTYEDVTNIDSVGIVTAQTGVRVTAGGLVVTAGVSTVQALQATTGTFSAAVSGTTGTFTGDVDIADKIVHTGDTNTALRFPSADTITAETGGSERVRINSTGDFGVGTASPTAKLDVRRDDATGKIAELHNSTGYGIDVGSGVTDTYVSSGYNQDFIFKTDAGSGQVERLRITSAGSVGINTTTPDRRFTLYQDATCRMNLKSLADSTAGIEFGDPADHNAGYIVYDNTNNSFQVGVNGTGEKVRIDSDGNIIVGSGGAWSFPKALNVQGASGSILSLYNADTTSYAADTSSAIEFKLLTGNTGNQTGAAEIRAFKENGTNGNNARGLSFWTAGNGGTNTEKVRITSTGGLHLTNGELLERFASYTSSANFNGGNVDLDDGMVHYCNQNLSGANTVNLTSSVGINTQMANGDMISLTLITSVNAATAYINHITVDHSATPTEMWVGGSAPGSGDGGTSNVDIYTFNLLKNGSNSYITIGNHIKTS